MIAMPKSNSRELKKGLVSKALAADSVGDCWEGEGRWATAGRGKGGTFYLVLCM